MIRFFWKSKVSPKTSSLDDVDLDLERISGAVKLVDGFPRIEWPLVHQAAARYADHPALGQIWTELAAQWMGVIRRHLGEHYRIYEGEHLLLLSTQDSGAARRFLEVGDGAYVRLERLVQRTPEQRGHGKHAVLVFQSSNDYYDYISYFYPERDRPYGTTGGMHLSRGYRHTAMNTAHSLPTLVHELAHDMVFDRALPRWVNEGLAQFAEDMVPGSSKPQVDARQVRLQRRYWSWFGTERFWNGKSFSTRSSQRLSYQLSEILFRNLAGHAVRSRDIGRFLKIANRSDAGQAACEDCFGCSLSELASEFLGEGNWGPSDYVAPAPRPRGT